MIQSAPIGRAVLACNYEVSTGPDINLVLYLLLLRFSLFTNDDKKSDSWTCQFVIN